MAWAAPLGPEIDHDQMQVRGRQDIVFKVMQVSVEYALILASVFVFVIVMLQRHGASAPSKNAASRVNGSCR
jgi:hypothetical protein